MASIILTNTSSPTQMKMRVTYTENGKGITITKVEGCRTDSYRTYDSNCTVYVNNSVLCTGADFPANSAWKSWWSGSKVLSNYTASFIFSSTNTNIKNAKFVFTATATTYNLAFRTHTGIESFTGPSTANLHSNVTSSCKTSVGYYIDHYTRKTGSVTTTITDSKGKTTDSYIFKNITGSTIFEAWAAAYSAKVTFHKNDGTSATYSETYTAGKTGQKFGMDLSSSGGDFGAWSRTGYTLKGWAKSPGAIEPDYNIYGNVGDQFCQNYHDGLDLYGVWEANVYIISFDANGGAGAPSAQEKQYNADVILSDVTPTREGYIFLGWAISKNATSPDYYPSSIVGAGTITSNITLYAVWQLITIYIKINGKWEPGIGYKKIDGEWKEGSSYIIT